MPYKRKFSRSRRYKRKARGKYSRRHRRTFQSRVTQVLMKKAETKYHDLAIDNVALYHNCGQFITLFPGYEVAIVDWFNPWKQIVKGTDRFNRIGDVITPRGMSLKMMLSTKADRPMTQFRILICTLPKVINGVITTARFDFRQVPNNISLDNNLISRVDTDKGVKVLYDKVISCHRNNAIYEGTGVKEGVRFLKLWIKRKRASNIVFDTLSTDIVNKPLAIYVIPYEQYNTLETDNIATISGNMRMYYKDV